MDVIIDALALIRDAWISEHSPIRAIATYPDAAKLAAFAFLAALVAWIGVKALRHKWRFRV